MKKFIFFILCLYSVSFAALPPFFQSKKEIMELLSDQRLTDKLGSGQAIVEIRRVEEGYIIETLRKEIKVEAHYHPSNRMGPVQFTFFFHEPVDKYLNKK